MNLPFDFTVPCRLNLQVRLTKYVQMPNLALFSNIKIRSIRVTRETPVNGTPGAIFVYGRILANNMQNFSPYDASRGFHPWIGEGENAVFEPVVLTTGNHADYWVGSFSGRGMEGRVRGRNSVVLGGIRTSVPVTGTGSKIKAYFNFRVNNNICNYQGWFQVYNHNGQGWGEGFISLGPELPYSFLPEPWGVVFGTSTGLPPGDKATIALNVTGAVEEYFTYADGFTPRIENADPNDGSVELLWDSTNPVVSDKLLLRFVIRNSEANQDIFYNFSGSYLTAEPITAQAFYGIT